MFIWLPLHLPLILTHSPLTPSHLPHGHPAPVQTEVTVILHTPYNTHFFFIFLLLILLRICSFAYTSVYQHSTRLREREGGREREGVGVEEKRWMEEGERQKEEQRRGQEMVGERMEERGRETEGKTVRG